MAVVYIGMGSNVGDRTAQLKSALTMLRKNLGIFIAHSSMYETAAWGYTSELSYYNMVVQFETEHTAEEILRMLHYIEASNGRTRSSDIRYTDRTLDLDLLYFDQLVLKTPELTLPHPHILSRAFVVIPLLEIDPDFTDFVTKKTLQEIASNGSMQQEIVAVIPFLND